MRHLKAGRKLNRNASHRAALLRNLTIALITHERIITTVAKAKALRPFVEKLITLAKRGSLHSRRLAIARLHDRDAVAKMFSDLAPRYADRPGGYTRIIRRHERRLGDAGETAFIELLKPGETKTRTRRAPAPAPAPRVEAPPAPAPETPPPQEQPTGQTEAPPVAPEQQAAESPAPPPTENKPEENPPAS
jgi:large subunit ribosomal protein L17